MTDQMNHNECNALRAFIFTCSELRQTAFGKQFRVASSQTYRLQPNTPHSTKCKNSDLDQWRSFILSFRKLVLNEDLGNFNRVLNVLSRHGTVIDQKNIRRIKQEPKAVENSLAGAAILIGEELRPVKPKEVFDTIVNGVLFHNDLSRQRDIDFFREAGVFAYGAMLHYIVYTYKQALRVESALRLRILI